MNLEWAMVAMVKEFTRDDWFGYCGCECWSDGKQPVILETDHWQFVADKNGAEAVDLEGTAFHLDLQFPTQKFAVSFLAGLPEDSSSFDPTEYGFKLV